MPQHKQAKATTAPLMTLAGIRNEGNLCYLNALLQVLFNLHPFASLLIKEHDEDDDDGGMPVWNALAQVYRDYRKRKSSTMGSGAVVSPRPLLDALRRRSLGSFGVLAGTQEDPAEFLTLFLEELDREHTRSNINAAGHSASAHSIPGSSDGNEWMAKTERGRLSTVRSAELGDSSPVTRLFAGCLQATIFRKGTALPSTVCEPFVCLPIDITQSTSEASSVQRALDAVNSEERLTTGDSQSVRRKVQLVHPFPEVFVLQVRRAVRRPDGSFAKDTRSIFLDPEISTGPSARYELVGVIGHVGSELASGHYRALVRHCDSWYECDDSFVEAAKNLRALSFRMASTTPYLLFYARMQSQSTTKSFGKTKASVASRFALLQDE